uniref:(California timema) hypothetical protein n=1 Tax=Timema californicum TaxID=61474 RepID=A0A7R9P306_TIMCA|nr:unnamed protein product [Timema californicum]
MVESSSTLPKCGRRAPSGDNSSCLHHPNTSSVMSAAANALLSRRRRNKTVHFGENLLAHSSPVSGTISRTRENRRDSVVSLPGQFEPNVQQLFSFIETVLSAWVVEEDTGTSQGEISEGDDLENVATPRRYVAYDGATFHRNRCRLRRTPSEVITLIGPNIYSDQDFGCPRYQHIHRRLLPHMCNAIFLSKCLQPIKTKVWDREFIKRCCHERTNCS